MALFILVFVDLLLDLINHKTQTMNLNCWTLRLFIGFYLSTICSCGISQSTHYTDESQSVLIEKSLQIIQENHPSPQTIDDALSLKIFDSFINTLDSEKKYFTIDQIHELQQFKNKIDDQLLAGSSQFFDECFSLYQNAISNSETYFNKYQKHSFDLKLNESYESNSDQISFQSSKKALKKHWRLVLKRQYLEELYLSEIKNPQYNFEQHNQIAQKKTIEHFTHQFVELKSKSKKDLFEKFINTYLKQNDYQSEYYSKEELDKWNANYNRSFVGVGISIETTSDYPMVTNVIFNGPCWKTNKIFIGNKFLAISDEQGEMIDLAGLPIKEVLNLLKGKKGTEVTVKVQNQGNEPGIDQAQIEEVIIQRDQVTMEQANSFILRESSSENNIAYLKLPRFYRGEEGCAAHIYSLLKELESQNVEGVIFDLRNNKGGASFEAIQITGYFLEGGPIMRSQYADGSSNMREDPEPKEKFDIKLVVMTNPRSASASELFAGNMQDYKRAIIVGSQTFGKGTMQNFHEIAEENDSLQFGEIKLSVGSYYTGKGISPQYKGIQPDIELPNKFSLTKTGERKIDNALKFDDLDVKIPKAESHIKQLENIRKLSKSRTSNNEYFTSILEQAKQYKAEQENTTIDLNYENFKKQKLHSIAQSSNKDIDNFEIQLLSFEKDKLDKLKYWQEKIENDHYIYECFKIMEDYLRLEEG